jgi:hypothetical protein
MAYALSFAPEFFWGDESEASALRPNARPTSVCEAVMSLKQETWDALAEQVFGIDGATLDVSTVMARIAETNTCRNLDSPVEVYIDADGDFSVQVYDRSDVH